jgi:hypothetical protein
MPPVPATNDKRALLNPFLMSIGCRADIPLQPLPGTFDRTFDLTISRQARASAIACATCSSSGFHAIGILREVSGIQDKPIARLPVTLYR